MKRYVFVPLVMVVSLVVLFKSNLALDRYRTPESALEETLYLPSAQVLKMASLGLQSFVADLLWVKLILYYGQHTLDEDNPFYHILKQREEHLLTEHRKMLQTHVETPSATAGREFVDFARDSLLHRRRVSLSDVRKASYMYPLLRRIVELDPHFIPPYEFASLVLLHDTREIARTQSLLQYGLRQNPARWEFPYYLGYIELFYTGNNEAALKWLSRAIALPGCPPFFADLYQRFLRKRGDYHIYVDYLEGLYQSTDNAQMRKSIRKRINDLKRQFEIGRPME